jgi:hypothetical protein
VPVDQNAADLVTDMEAGRALRLFVDVDVVHLEPWLKPTTGDEMRDLIIGALDPRPSS